MHTISVLMEYRNSRFFIFVTFVLIDMIDRDVSNMCSEHGWNKGRWAHGPMAHRLMGWPIGMASDTSICIRIAFRNSRIRHPPSKSKTRHAHSFLHQVSETCFKLISIDFVHFAQFFLHPPMCKVTLGVRFDWPNFPIRFFLALGGILGIPLGQKYQSIFQFHTL